MERFFTVLRSVFTTPEIRERLVFSLFVIVLFRVLATIPVVGINAEALSSLFAQLGGFGETISTVSGGVLATASIVAIGIGPYINSSIIFQLLGSVVPKLEELKKEGSSGRRVITMYTRYLSLPLAILQSFVIYSTLRGFGLVDELQTLELVTMVAALTGGAMLMMWIGEQFTEKGFGNGASYIIFLGIVAALPSIVADSMRTADPAEATWFFAVMILVTALTIYVTQGERRVKILYSRRVRATGNQESYVPVKITQFGVLPVIFAVSLLSFPQLIAQFVLSRDISQNVNQIAQSIITMSLDVNFQNITTFILVVLFSFFYITVVFNTKELAENLQKQGAFIPGIRPGKMTASYLRTVSFRLTAVGAIFLGLLAILPALLVQMGVLSSSIISGTGLLIVVGVVLEIKRRVESMIIVRSYDKYL